MGSVAVAPSTQTPLFRAEPNWDDATTTANFGQIATAVNILLPLLVVWTFTAKSILRLIFQRIRGNPKSDFIAPCIIYFHRTPVPNNRQVGISGCALSLKLSSRLSRPLGRWTEGAAVVNRLPGLFEQLKSTVSAYIFLPRFFLRLQDR